MIGKNILHYEIIEKLGEGGMGIVYLAEDTKLKRRVAIKFLPHRITANSDESKRFEIEAQAAAALNHPNIATIYAIEQISDEMFIVMEYVDGMELKEKLKSDPISIDDSQNIALQIARGLQEAHEKNIIHRDIKSANIMITKKGQVKIMDFGLAKVHGGAELTQEQSTIGTAAYMSPEQARGDKVDQRSDQWSFGVIFYEMLTGQLPFRGDYDQAVIYSILNEEADNPQSINQEIPELIAACIIKCLQKDRELRYLNMSAVINDLTANHTHSSTSTIAINNNSLPASVSKNKKVLYIGGLFIVLMLVIVWQFINSDNSISSAGVKKDNSIAVMYFENNSSDEEMKWFSRGLPHMLITDLEREREIEVMGYQRMYDILKQMDLEENENIDRSIASDVAQKAGINNILYGSIFKMGEQIRIDFQLENMTDGKIIMADHVLGSEVLQLADRISEKIIGQFHNKTNNASFENKSRKSATDNIQAYRYFFEGEKLLNQYQWTEAAEQFTNAIKLDSTFALAYYKYAIAVDWTEDTSTVNTSYYFEQALKYGDRLNDCNLRLTRALLEIDKQGLEKSIPLFEQIVKDYPEDKEALYQLSESYYHGNYFEKAIAVMEELLLLDPDFRLGMAHMSEAYLGMGDFEKATVEVNHQIRINPTESRPYVVFADIQTLRGNKVEAYAYYDSAIIKYTDNEFINDPNMAKISAMILFGNFNKTEQELLKYLEKNIIALNNPERASSFIYLLLSYLKELMGDSEKALTYINIAKKIFSHARIWRDLGTWHAQFGEIRKAKALADSILQKNYGEPNRYYYHLSGYIALAEKDFPRAIDNFSKSGTSLKYRYPLLLAYKLNKDYEKGIRLGEKLTPLGGKNIIRLPDMWINYYNTLYYSYFIYELGTVYELSGDNKKALQTYEHIINVWKDADKDIPLYKKTIQKIDNLKDVL
jgi:non-specific serine/threonine protein kinase